MDTVGTAEGLEGDSLFGEPLLEGSPVAEGGKEEPEGVIERVLVSELVAGPLGEEQVLESH